MKNTPSLFDQVPSAVEAPTHAEPSLVATPPENWGRRRVLGALTGVAVASGLALLDLFPWSRPRSAEAAAYTAWSDCRGYFDSTTICVPSSAYYNSNNCSGSWHRNDGSSGTCYTYRYTHDPSSCDGHNAWKWTGAVARRKCSDGWYQYYDCGGTAISRFSICRTAI